MSGTTLAVVADRVERLTKRVDDLEKQMDAVMAMQRWQMGAAVGFGVVLTLLLPKISHALGLS